MAKFSLVPFDQSNSPDTSIDVEINQNNDSLFLSYRIKENVAQLDLGNGTPNKTRLIKLWEKTCFEFFIKNKLGNYIEFNFSPTFEWNCFYFEKKGDPLKEWEKMNYPIMDVLLSIDHFLLIIEIKKSYFPAGFFEIDSELECSLTSVIKEKSERLSYWALHHADTRPNFHHFDSFKYKF